MVAVAFGAVASAVVLAAPAWGSPEPPSVQPATGVFATTAVLHGVLDPASSVFPVEAGTYQFLYKATKVATKAECESGASAAPASPGAYFGNEPEGVSEAISGLAPETGYVVCLAATNAKSETTLSAPVSFETVAAVAPEAPEATEALEVRATTANLDGVLNPKSEGEPGSYSFVYRQSASECAGAGSKETTKEPESGASQVAVAASVSGLVAGKAYSYCVEVFNALGEGTLSPSVPLSHFTTTTPPEKPVSEAATEVTATTASVHGELNPGSEAETGYHFLYNAAGPCAGGAASEGVAPALLPAKTKVEAKLTGLQPNDEYTVCLVATDLAGDEVLGNEVSVKTLPAAPEVTGETVSAVAFDSATVEAEINPNNQETTYTVQYSTQASGETLTGSITTLNGASLLNGFGQQAASVETGTSLVQDTTYFYRVIAKDTGGEETIGKLQRFTTLPEAPVGVEALEVSGSTAIVKGVLNPNSPGEAGANYEFRYQESESECENGGRSGGTSSGSSPEAVQAHLTGLKANTKYAVCLRVHNSGGQTAVSSPAVVFATLPVPILTSESSSNETASTADLAASVNPDGSELTQCVFEYGTSTAYASGTVPCEQSLTGIGAGSQPVLVTAKLTNLEGNTPYHWRIVTANASGVTLGIDHTFIVNTGSGATGGSCPDEQVRAQDHSTALPDCRSYELVTPPEKNGALIDALFASGGPWGPLISNDGKSVMAPSIQCFAGTQSCTGIRETEAEPYEFNRTSQGWVTHALAPPATQFGNTSELAADPNSHKTVFAGSDPPEDHHDNFYARTGDGPSVALGPLSETAENTSGVAVKNLEVGTSPTVETSDLSHLIFQTVSAASGEFLWSLDESPEEQAEVYEYAGQNTGRPLAVAVTGPYGSTSLISQCESFVGSKIRAVAPFGALSETGHTVYFTADRLGEGFCQGSAAPPADEIYARVDGERSDAHTVAISASTPASCKSAECKTSEGEPENAYFQGASRDGSRVFFTSTQQLTDHAVKGNGEPGDENFNPCARAPGSGCNLYASVCAEPCGVPGEELAAKERELVDVSEAEGGKQPAEGPQVQGVMAISPDGSHVYFVARGKLAGNQGVTGAVAQEGQDNMYVYTVGSPLRFIATLPPSDEEELLGDFAPVWVQGNLVANVTPDGRFLVFPSKGALTSDETRPENRAQIYRYDAKTGTMVRISIGQNGYNDNGDAGSPEAEPGIVPAEKGWYRTTVPARANPTMSDDGQYVFFESPVALTPGALNELNVTKPPAVQLLAENVYEYHDGSVSLISDGEDTTPNSSATGITSSTHLYGTDPSGHNVFFATNDQLTSQDTDTQRDYYDARICEESDACVAPPAAPVACQEEACHLPASPQPSATLTGSSTLQGTGNLPPAAPGAVVAHLSVLTHSARGMKFAVKVTLTVAGRLVVTGAAIDKVSRTLKAGAHQTLVIALTPAARRTLHTKHKLKLKLHMAYTPAGGHPISLATAITVKP